jgi:hypothetical protein
MATKDSICQKKKDWPRILNPWFYDDFETIHHLFLSVRRQKYMWSVVSKTIGAPNRPIF